MALAVVIPLAGLAGYMVAHHLASPPRDSLGAGPQLVGMVTHVRDGDTIEVRGVPVRIANLDCAELDTTAGRNAKALMRRLAASGPKAAAPTTGKSTSAAFQTSGMSVRR